MATKNPHATTAARHMRENWFERAALGASMLCLVHCLALPLIVAALPALSSVLAIPESFHFYVLAFAVPVSGWALADGRGRHGATWPLMLGLAGLALLATGALILGGTRGETPVTVLGSLALAAGHIANWRLRHAHHRAALPHPPPTPPDRCPDAGDAGGRRGERRG